MTQPVDCTPAWALFCQMASAENLEDLVVGDKREVLKKIVQDIYLIGVNVGRASEDDRWPIGLP